MAESHGNVKGATAHTAAEGGHMIMGQGAVPIIRNGVVEGACGVSGGTAQEDEDCSRAGLARL